MGNNFDCRPVKARVASTRTLILTRMYVMNTIPQRPVHRMFSRTGLLVLSVLLASPGLAATTGGTATNRSAKTVEVTLSEWKVQLSPDRHPTPPRSTPWGLPVRQLGEVQRPERLALAERVRFELGTRSRCRRSRSRRG